VFKTLRRLLCSHDDLKACEPKTRRVHLRCVNCGRETRGWQIDPWEPPLTQPGDQQRHVIFNPRLVLATRRGAPVWLRSVHSNVRRGA
jgi:hypothetical protein